VLNEITEVQSVDPSGIDKAKIIEEIVNDLLKDGIKKEKARELAEKIFVRFGY